MKFGITRGSQKITASQMLRLAQVVGTARLVAAAVCVIALAPVASRSARPHRIVVQAAPIAAMTTSYMMMRVLVQRSAPRLKTGFPRRRFKPSVRYPRSTRSDTKGSSKLPCAMSSSAMGLPILPCTSDRNATPSAPGLSTGGNGGWWLARQAMAPMGMGGDA